jgi:hypothetical protein
LAAASPDLQTLAEITENTEYVKESNGCHFSAGHFTLCRLLKVPADLLIQISCKLE